MTDEKRDPDSDHKTEQTKSEQVEKPGLPGLESKANQRPTSGRKPLFGS